MMFNDESVRDDTDQTTQFTSNPLVTLNIDREDSDDVPPAIYEGRLTVTWLEAFLDLSVVVTIHEVAERLQDADLKAADFVNFVLRISLLYWTWHRASILFNLKGKKRLRKKMKMQAAVESHRLRRSGAGSASASRYEITTAVDEWLGWWCTGSTFLTMACVSFMGNAATRGDDRQYLGFFLLAQVVGAVTWFRNTDGDNDGARNISGHKRTTLALVAVCVAVAAALVVIVLLLLHDDEGSMGPVAVHATCGLSFGAWTIRFALASIADNQNKNNKDNKNAAASSSSSPSSAASSSLAPASRSRTATTITITTRASTNNSNKAEQQWELRQRTAKMQQQQQQQQQQPQREEAVEEGVTTATLTAKSSVAASTSSSSTAQNSKKETKGVFSSFFSSTLDALLDKEHLEERHCLLTLMLIGESVGVASAVVPTSDEPQAFFVALASLASAASLWILYFGTQPKGFKRLPSPHLPPPRPPRPSFSLPPGDSGGGSGSSGNDAGVGNGGSHATGDGKTNHLCWLSAPLKRALSRVFSPLFSRGAAATVAFAFFHSCYCTCLAATASAYARMVALTAARAAADGSVETTEKEERASKLILCCAAAAFLMLSGLQLAMGEDNHNPPPLLQLPPRRRRRRCRSSHEIDKKDGKSVGGGTDDDDEDIDLKKRGASFDLHNDNHHHGESDNKEAADDYDEEGGVGNWQHPPPAATLPALAPTQRGTVRALLGLALLVAALGTTAAVKVEDGQEGAKNGDDDDDDDDDGRNKLDTRELFEVEWWAGVVPAVFVLSAYLETKEKKAPTLVPVPEITALSLEQKSASFSRELPGIDV